jgi:hypothetical protein
MGLQGPPYSPPPPLEERCHLAGCFSYETPPLDCNFSLIQAPLTVYGQQIRCWGSKQAALQLSGVSYSWKFLLADVKFPILGIDFLRHHKLLVDMVGVQLSPRQPSASADAGTESPAAVCSSVSPPVEGTWRSKAVFSRRRTATWCRASHRHIRAAGDCQISLPRPHAIGSCKDRI